MWRFFAIGALCRLRKHGSNCSWLAGKLKYFCDSSVIWKLAGQRGCDTARVNDHGLSYFEDYLLGTTYECGSVSIDPVTAAYARQRVAVKRFAPAVHDHFYIVTNASRPVPVVADAFCDAVREAFGRVVAEV